NLHTLDHSEKHLLGEVVKFVGGRLIGLQELLGMIEVEMTDAPEKLASALSCAGFPATLQKELVMREVKGGAVAAIQVEGMTCSACVATVENALRGVKGVTDASVNLLMKRAEVTHQGVPVETLLDAIDCIGFDAELLEAREEAATQRDGVFGKEFVALVWPRVHVPTCSVAMFDFDSLPDATSDAGPAGARRFGVYAVSDIHTDKRENMDVIREWPRRPNDILLLAGDVSNDLDIVRRTFQLVLERFGQVFYCPGNHDLWLHNKDGCKDSLQKFRSLEVLCEELGVRTRPGWADKEESVFIVPLLSWYHAGFDAEPDISDDSLVPVERMMSDYMLCRWPDGLSASNGCDSLARYFDSLNEERAAAIPAKDPCTTVISFSHFLPRQELLPEKRLLYFPPIAKAVGSRHLGERIRALAPDLHIFGHTHYGWSTQLDGTRYLQACVAYPRERSDRPFSIYCRGE
ncbi:HMA5, partial [Symbiodinium microadriaticum]